MVALRTKRLMIPGIVLLCSSAEWSHSVIAGADNVPVVCCGSVAAVIEGPAAAAEPEGRKITPKLTPVELEQLQLLDVHITSARHFDGRKPIRTPGNPAITPMTAAHVKVDGVIGGTIQFELLLPDEWNGRFAMGGGGGFVGRVSNLIRDSVNNGYATAGTDTGHQSPSGRTAAWALDHLEAQVNYGHLAIHRTALAAKAIISAWYGRESRYCYFFGCSTGGGQALIEAQRYPADFDGIISAAPVVQHTGLAAARLYNALKLFPDPARIETPIITEEQLTKLNEEVLRVCDEQDGVRDGILDDPRQCRFDLTQMEWLTPTQRDALQALYDGPANESGQIYPGMPLGSEGRWYLWKAGANPGYLTRDKYPNPGFALGIEFCKYFIFNDPNWDYSSYDMANWQSDSHRAGTLLNANNPDLSRFRESGGKLILWHGWNDGPLTPLASIEYYENVERLDPEIRDFFRFYLLPGVRHCGGGPGPDRVDWLSVLGRWVEEGIAPERLIASKIDAAGNATTTRTIYPYPLRAVYNGTGSTDEAENFVLPASQ